MSEIHADGGPLSFIPDDLTISQFLLDVQHPVRPIRTGSQAWLIEEASGRKIGSDELRARVYGLANALKTRWNIGENDVVCLFSPNHVDYVVAMWAVQQLGGIITTSNPLYTSDELCSQLETTKAKMLVVHPTMLPVAYQAANAVNLPRDRIVLIEALKNSPHHNLESLVRFGLKEQRRFTQRRLKAGEARTKLALLLFSSGTTGKPKAVMITHYSLVANLVQYGQYLQLVEENPRKRKLHHPGSIALGSLPFFHVYGLHTVLFGNMFVGTTVVVSPRFQLERMLQSIQEYRITHLYLVPFQLVLLCKNPIVKKYDLSSIQFVVSGAAPAGAELTTQLTPLLPQAVFGQGFGMTEVACLVSFVQLDRQVGAPGSAGILIPGVTIRVVKSDGSLAKYGEVGEMYVKSPSISSGYLNNPAATAETYLDGWLRTGDEVKITSSKELFVIDRIKELIKVRAFQVAPSELEGHLLGHPDVADVCVVGIPDEYSGERPFAFVVLSAGARARVERDAAEAKRVGQMIMKHVSDHKTKFKWLAGVHFVDAVPKNPTGKLLRRVLRDEAKAMLASGKLELEITHPNQRVQPAPEHAGTDAGVADDLKRKRERDASGGQPRARL